MSINIEAPGGSEADLRAALRGLAFPLVDTVETAFWADIDSVAPSIHRMRDRVFVGNAALMHENRAGDNATWVPNAAAGANWAPRDSQLVVMHDRGGLAITGMSRTSDGAGVSSLSSWGLGGLVVADLASSFSRAIYGDVQAANGIAGAVGLELAIKNKASAETTAFSPYSVTDGTKGIVVTAGGDPTYGGVPVSHVAAGLVFRTGDNAGAAGYKFVKGIVFDQYSLKGADGTGGGAQRAGIAIEMAVGHNIVWTGTGNVRSAAIMATGVGSTNAVTQIFQNDVVLWTGNSGGTLFRAVNTNNAVNYLSASNSITANSPALSAVGSDTDIDIRFTPQGAGVMRFGTHSAIAAETLSGYITIKDAGGTTRKVAVVS